MTATSKTNARNTQNVWTAPVVSVIDLNAAKGATAGPLCDKYGSLSHGSGC